MNPVRWSWIVLGGLLLALAAPAHAQDNPFNLPQDLLPFWTRYYEAKGQDDEADMDSAVRRDHQDAEDVLAILLDGLSQQEDYVRQSEARTLARSLDRVDRTEMHMERTRFVIDLDMKSRRLRSAGVAYYGRAQDARQEALDAAEAGEATPEQWAKVEDLFASALENFQAIGDHEFAVHCLTQMQRIEDTLGRIGQRAELLDKVIAEGAELPFSMPEVAEARDAQAQIQAELEKTGKTLEEAAAESHGGRTLMDFADGSEEQSFPLELVVPRKGLDSLDLPTFAPPEQFQLWHVTRILGEGPTGFDNYRGTVLKPYGKQWSLGREGVAKFWIDSDDDGKRDVEFVPSATPSLIEVPEPGAPEPYPLMVCVGGTSEYWFNFKANQAPTQDFAFLRFSPAFWLEGDVLGDTWRLIDLNMDGVWGLYTQTWDDLITYSTDEEGVTFGEVDAVAIGRDDRALPLSTVMRVDDRFYRTWVDWPERRVRVRELNLLQGTVTVDADLKTQPGHLVAREISGKLEGALFDLMPERKGKPVTLPVGEYQILMGVITSGKKTDMDVIRIYTGNAEPFKVFADTETHLELGAPFTLTFDVAQEGDDFVVKTTTIRIFGRGGEEYAMLYDVPLQPELEIRTLDDHKVLKPEKLREAGQAQWQQDPRSLWFPVPWREPNTDGKPLKARLTQKSHKLLGGPFDSGWVQ